MLNLSLSNSARWAFNVAAWQPTESQYLLASSCIQEEEKSRIGRFVFKKDAKASLTGRLLLRKYVCDTSGLPYSEINFDRDVNGRPRLVCDDSKRELARSLHFNVSHHGDYAVLAGEVGNVQLGIDVMKIEYTGGKPLSEFFRLMTRHFSMQEWNTIRGVHGTSESKQLAMFIRHWCLKESYVKALGVGITVDLRNISFKVKTPMLTCGAMTCDTQIYVNGGNAWTAQSSDFDQYLVIDLGQVRNITEIATQGRPFSSEYVMEYAISYGTNGLDYADYKEPGGNTKLMTRIAVMSQPPPYSTFSRTVNPYVGNLARSPHTGAEATSSHLIAYKDITSSIELYQNLTQPEEEALLLAALMDKEEQ
ncbi:unnamed protein product [Timema podura]|uniref:L-aminoadipate-semialdehyde dehydrogenase-phosphopantetheinyl transferase n=1 Tax=Timema podura TaxID=61482 RepID=A0ABN7NP85_TIMPD|nr:unnamed protein product [Timema podura]